MKLLIRILLLPVALAIVIPFQLILLIPLLLFWAFQKDFDNKVAIDHFCPIKGMWPFSIVSK